MADSRASGATRIALAVTLAVVLFVVSAGCMPPDRSDRARSLESELAVLSDVDSADVLYANDFENGTELDVKVVMTHADDEQIAAVVSRLDAVNRSDFRGYRREALGGGESHF